MTVLRVAAILVLAASAGCKESGSARKIAEAPPAAAPAPTWEPQPGDGPRCDEIGARIAANTGARIADVQVGEARTEVQFDLGAAAGTALRDACRRARWTRAQRDCAFAFDGKIIEEMARFRSTCLGKTR
jgi:hypothetical protein